MIINDNEAAQAQVEVAPVKKKNGVLKRYEGVICLLVVFGLFYYLGREMGTANMLNTLMHTAHDLLLNTV